jgi:hypothetical protein
MAGGPPRWCAKDGYAVQVLVPFSLNLMRPSTPRSLVLGRAADVRAGFLAAFPKVASYFCRVPSAATPVRVPRTASAQL